MAQALVEQAEYSRKIRILIFFHPGPIFSRSTTSLEYSKMKTITLAAILGLAAASAHAEAALEDLTVSDFASMASLMENEAAVSHKMAAAETLTGLSLRGTVSTLGAWRRSCLSSDRQIRSPLPPSARPMWILMVITKVITSKARLNPPGLACWWIIFRWAVHSIFQVVPSTLITRSAGARIMWLSPVSQRMSR